MSKLIKSIATLGVVALVSVGASTATYRYLHQGSLFGGTSEDLSITLRNPSEESAYAFHNTAMAIPADQRGFAPDLTEAAERSVQAVVHIKVEGERETAAQQMIDPFEFFFGGQGGGSRRQIQPVVGYGSGVIISSDGYIITNNHVIDSSNKISVTLDDKRQFTATLVGTDPNTDIALIKIDAKDLPSIPFGDSDKVRLGEWVLAVGNPLNLTGTVTAGIISAKGRSTARSDGRGFNKVESFIQTDAAVNSGNSGGALVYAQGELIGINTMIYSQTGSFAGYSFAVPINMAAKVVEDIKRFGTVQRGLLGISGMDVSAELAKKEGLKVTKGVYVAEFAEISAALASGIEAGDVITAINEQPIDDFGQLQGEVGRYRPGDTILVTIDRKGTKRSYKVTLRNQEGGQGLLKESASAAPQQLGATIKPLEVAKLRSYGLSYGLLVEKVTKGGLLGNAGVHEGYIILTAGNAPMRTVADLNRAIEAAKSSGGNGRYASEAAIRIRGFYPLNGDVVSYTIPLK